MPLYPKVIQGLLHTVLWMSTFTKLQVKHLAEHTAKGPDVQQYVCYEENLTTVQKDTI